MQKILWSMVVACGLVGAALVPAQATPLTSAAPGAVTAQSSDSLVTDVRMTKKQMMMRKKMMMKKRMMNRNM